MVADVLDGQGLDGVGCGLDGQMQIVRGGTLDTTAVAQLGEGGQIKRARSGLAGCGAVVALGWMELCPDRPPGPPWRRGEWPGLVADRTGARVTLVRAP